MGRSLIGELKAILSNRKLLIPTIAVLFIPVLYSGMFLWAFWDPYDHLSDLPVAVVNSDSGADFEGTELNIGEELVKKLGESDDFKFSIIDRDKAYSDLEKQKYYMVVEIPENFSENATTLLDEKPKKMELMYVPNEGFNFLSGQIGNTAMLKIQASIQENVTKTYTEAIFKKVEEMADGFTQASDGAGKLNDGAIMLSEGTEQIKENLALLAEKSVEFKQGVETASDGSNQLAAGATELSSGLEQLKKGHDQLLQGSIAANSGTNQLSEGFGQVNSGLKTIDSKMEELMKGTEQISSGLEQFNQKVPELEKGSKDLANGAVALDSGIKQFEQELTAQLEKASKQQFEQLLPYLQQSMTPEQLAGLKQQMEQQQVMMQKQISGGFDQLKTGSSQLVAGAGQLESSLTTQVGPNVSKLNEGVKQISAGQKQLGDGVHQLVQGSVDLNDGINKLEAGQSELLAGTKVFNEKLQAAAAGSEKIVSGTSSLTYGLSQLVDGSEKISEGTVKLADGSKELSSGTNKLADGTEELSKKLGDASEKTSSVKAEDDNFDMMASPVKVDQKGVNKVPNYGTGFTPYFLSLGLFVGALLISIVYPLVEPAIKPESGLSWFTSKLTILFGVGIIQALVAVSIILFGLGLEVQNLPLFIMTTIITSLTFMTLIQMLVSILGDPGRFVAIIVLILQLTTSAGTFPLELIPSALQPISAFLPMTYSVSAFKAVISSGDYSFMWNNLFILLGYTITFAIITMIFFTGLFKKKFSYTAE
ncbi:YhgE/Pip domain-containing protein [Bacillus sp. 31A1R]|uniref:YhgE/Pip domain-containing protein n=1 Tax=Robertmurraya mangrovi TaxID=3098077 RepID=A0ABU5IYF7_9BACI|nr:YhgE/Pip domain-containing protein [Bacillus sp. 31A1R]MDZ5472204.1 YhgE/Pip domain-containing protein [Bacillus sp. 31A1R]